MSQFTDWRDGIENKIQQQITPSSNGGQGAIQQSGGGIYDAIYQYGRGQVDTAIQTLTKAIRGTPAGQKVEAEATKQKLQELMPMILLGVVVLIAGTLFFARRG